MEDEAAHRIQYAHLRIFREKLQGGSVYIAIITEGEEEDLRGGGAGKYMSQFVGAFFKVVLILGTQSSYLVSGFSKSPLLGAFGNTPLGTYVVSTHLVRSWPCLSSYNYNTVRREGYYILFPHSTFPFLVI